MDYIRNSILKEENVKQLKVLVAGVGATGSHIVIELVKLGFMDITIYDTGEVKEHNVTNQVYPIGAVGQLKQDVLAQLVKVRYNADVTKLLSQPDHSEEYDIVFNCVDDKDSRNYYRKNIQYKKLFIETAFDVYSSDLFMITDIQKLKSIPTGEGNTSEVVSACGSRLTVSASINNFVGAVIWGLINFLNEEEGFEDYLNKRLTFKHFNPISVLPIEEVVIGDEFFKL